jgi:hypothetical protein
MVGVGAGPVAIISAWCGNDDSHIVWPQSDGDAWCGRGEVDDGATIRQRPALHKGSAYRANLIERAQTSLVWPSTLPSGPEKGNLMWREVSTPTKTQEQPNSSNDVA